MLPKESRKEAIRRFKESKKPMGTYAIRCMESGRVWVGASRNLEATKNGSWFSLRNGSHQSTELQREWQERGEAAFEYQILESLSEELHPLAIDDRLKEMKLNWSNRLAAKPLL